MESNEKLEFNENKFKMNQKDRNRKRYIAKKRRSHKNTDVSVPRHKTGPTPTKKQRRALRSLQRFLMWCNV